MNNQSPSAVPVAESRPQQGPGEAAHATATAPSAAQRQSSLSTPGTVTGTQNFHGLKQGVGSALLRFCLGEKKTCANTHCWLQPICACARADLERSRKMETRVWLAIAGAAAVVILVAILWAHGSP